MLSKFRSFKALLAIAAMASVALLGGCGGGGAQDPLAPGPSAPTLSVSPGAVTLYSNVPAVITVTSGTAPFQVFSSDATVLPVAAVNGGTLITLTPNNVSADTAVSVSVRDRSGQNVTVAATVKPATLVNQVAITPISNTRCGAPNNPVPEDTPGNRTPICAGETATASVIVRSANASVIPNRQVRFDVVFGAFKFVTDANGSNASNSVTLTTDQNGRATTLIKADDGVPSQGAVIRATDLVTGSRVDTAFSIVQLIDGGPVMSVVPGGYTGKGFGKDECGGTSGDFLIYGGRPPYTVRSSLPNAVRLSVGGVFGDPVIVAASGGSFRASSLFTFPCGGFEAAIVITDANGQIRTVTYKEEPGTQTPPPPTPLVVTPSRALVTCVLGRAVTFAIIGGTQPHTVQTNRPADVSVAVTGSVAVVTITAPGGLTAAQDVTVEVIDSASLGTSATIDCQ